MIHRGNHRVSQREDKMALLHVEKRAVETMAANEQHQGSNDEEREQMLKLSITECSTVSGDERQGPDLTAHAMENKHVSAPEFRKKRSAFVLTLTRLLFLDSPMVLVFGTFMFLVWVHYVHDQYLVKQIEAARWTFERDTTDATYYYRYCDERDLTTTDPLDLYLSHDATPQDAYQHQLTHGFTMFPGVLSQETASNLRNYIISKNKQLTEEESIWLIQWNNRWSFSLGIEEPPVTKAVMELASNRRLKESMALILGDDPALIELTSITSAYGAKAQHFHHDGRTNLAQYARGVAHSYSIFIQLQNTTGSMGATGACPGSHYCAEGLDQVCDDHGVQPVNENGYWAAGDAMVMNMDGWHRGAAHTDPNGPDRVMICITFTSKPRERAESRQLPQGISYSLRWDLWGHTWKDLETADVTMRQPWTSLRALGLYKSPSASYGVDYVSSVSQRMANEYFGFTKEDLEFFVRLGGFKFLPHWLQGTTDDETTWHDVLLNTLLICKEFMRAVSMYSVGVYLILCSVAGWVFGGGFKGATRRFGSAALRLTVLGALIFAVYKAAIKYVDESQWASDLRNGLRYTSPFGIGFSEYDGPLTMPYRNDVLIETRYKSEYLAVYNDFIGNFPGNRLWNELVDEKAVLCTAYSTDLPSIFSEAVSEFIVSGVYDSAGRFLYQKRNSHWVEMSREDAIKHTKLELAIKSNSILGHVVKQIDYLISEAKYGPLRKTAMMEMDIFPWLLELKYLLIGVSTERTSKNTSTVRIGEVSTTPSTQFVVSSSLSKPQTMVRQSPRRPVGFHRGVLREEPEPNAWLREDDVVAVKIKEGENWGIFKATLTHVLSSGICFVQLHVGDTLQQVECKDVSRYISPIIGDRVKVQIDEQYYPGTIVEEKGEDLVDVDVSGRIFEDVGGDLLLRPLK